MDYRSTREAARILEISVARLTKAVWDGRVDPPAKSPSGAYLWTAEDIEHASWALLHRSTDRQAEQPKPTESATDANDLATVIFTDGAALPTNPGHAAGGWMIYRKGQIISAGARYIGQATSNTAEFRGLIFGLEAAIEAGLSHVEVFSDSRLVVEQVHGRWRCRKPHLRKLRDEALALLARFASWELAWISRQENGEADELANQAARERVNIRRAAHAVH